MLPISKANTTSVLASFATLKSLSDEKKYRSPYQILGEFIRYIIILDSLYTFSAVEMKSYLNGHFDFSIPEAVIKTSLKNMAGINLVDSIYNVTMSEIGTDSLFESKKREADEYSTNIIRLLSEYIINKTDNKAVEEKVITHELVNFLIKDQNISSTRYAELISEFIIKNEKNNDIQEGLNRIREGSILYLGLSHNISETGSITKPLKLYLSTEILFSLIGFNGEIFKQFAKDFYEQIRLANSNGQKKIVLYYFSETKKEIDEFFAIAEEIVDGKKQQWLNKPAMKAILDGCNSSADVTVKQSDFYTNLRICYGITEDPHENYYDEISFTSNLESFDYDDEDDKKKKKEIGLKFISHINKLRDGKHFSNELDAEHLFVTNTKATLLISKEQTDIIKREEKLDRICGFAVSLDWITSLLWYKLGNGFAKKDFPTNISAALKARIVLSSSIAKKADMEFAEIKKLYKTGSITEDQVAARIIALRNKPKLPEDLEGDDIDEIMNFSPEYLNRYEEQFKSTQKSLKEKEKLIESIKADRDKTMSQKDATIASQADIIKEKNNENKKLRNKLDEYHHKEAEAARKKERRKNIWRFVWSIIWKVLILAILSALVAILYMNNFIFFACISTVVDFLCVLGTFFSVFKKDKEKYLPKRDKPTKPKI